MKIWCLLSVDNNYDQPKNNLVAWWETKPNIQQLANIIGYNLDIKKGSKELGHLLNMEEVRIDNTDYRLEEVWNNTKLKKWEL
jgi:hypothetical protein